MIVLSRAELIDVPLSWPVASSRVLADGRIASFVEDQVHAPDGEEMTGNIFVTWVPWASSRSMISLESPSYGSIAMPSGTD